MRFRKALAIPDWKARVETLFKVGPFSVCLVWPLGLTSHASMIGFELTAGCLDDTAAA